MGFLQRFFYGRNGTDPLNIALLVLGLVISFLGRFTGFSFLEFIAMGLLALCVFRMLSRNVTRRRQENALFLEKTKRFRRGSSAGTGTPRVKKDPNFRYFKCPRCKQNLRAPRGKGKVRITCSKCGNVFEKSV